MKIVQNSAKKAVSTNLGEIEISKNTKKHLKYLILQLLLILLLLIPTHCFSTEKIIKIEVPKKNQTFSYRSNSSTLESSSDAEQDTDNDGVPDILDFDDDNDGILDHHEGFYNINSLRGESIVVTINGAWVLVYTSVYVELPLDLKHGDEFWIPFLGKQYVKAVRIRFENTFNGVRFIQTAAKHTIGNDPELDEDLNYDFDNGGIVSPIALADTDEGYGIASISYKDQVIIPEYLGTSGQEVIGPELDTDNDGFIDSRDTDSDNDGCPDAIEAEDNITTSTVLENGSNNGGSLENLGFLVNNNGIPLPYGTLGGNEETGQYNSKAVITSELLTVASLENMTVKSGDDANISVDASAVKTSTFNIGVPNYSDLYSTDTSDLITYEWYKTSDLNTVLSTSKTLVLENVDSSKEGTYLVKIKGAGNSCVVEETVTLTVEEDVLSTTENFNEYQKKFTAYPNPSNGNINLVIPSKKKSEATIILYDISGKEIFHTQKKLMVGNNKIDFIVNAASGVSFLKVISKDVNYGITKVLFK